MLVLEHNPPSTASLHAHRAMAERLDPEVRPLFFSPVRLLLLLEPSFLFSMIHTYPSAHVLMHIATASLP